MFLNRIPSWKITIFFFFFLPYPQSSLLLMVLLFCLGDCGKSNLFLVCDDGTAAARVKEKVPSYIYLYLRFFPPVFLILYWTTDRMCVYLCIYTRFFNGSRRRRVDTWRTREIIYKTSSFMRDFNIVRPDGRRWLLVRKYYTQQFAAEPLLSYCC